MDAGTVWGEWIICIKKKSEKKKTTYDGGGGSHDKPNKYHSIFYLGNTKCLGPIPVFSQ